MKGLLFAVLGFSFALSTQAQMALGPKLEATALVVDYGTIKKASEKARVWKFRNTGTEPLVITNTEGSCGCTVPTKPERPIPPRANGEIKIEYDTQRVGPFEKTVTITTNEVEGKDAAGNPIYRRVVVKVKGTVEE